MRSGGNGGLKNLGVGAAAGGSSSFINDDRTFWLGLRRLRRGAVVTEALDSDRDVQPKCSNSRWPTRPHGNVGLSCGGTIRGFVDKVG